jgi:IS66 C-terminal element
MYTLIATAKLNGVDPQAWLADVLRRIADHRLPAARAAALALEAARNPSRCRLTTQPIAAFAGCLRMGDIAK